MNYVELIDYLELENGSQLQYFEEMADLIESDEPIEHEALMQLFGEAQTETVAGLLEEYFQDVTGGIPEEYSDMFALMDRIRLELTGTIRGASAEDPDSIRDFTDRFYRFRNWYVYDTEVSVLENASREYIQSVRDAIATARAGQFSGGEYAFDFSPALDYEIDYYAMSFSDLIDAAETQDDEE